MTLGSSFCSLFCLLPNLCVCVAGAGASNTILPCHPLKEVLLSHQTKADPPSPLKPSALSLHSKNKLFAKTISNC